MDTIEQVERELSRAREAEGEEAMKRLESAHERLESAREEFDDEAKLDALATEIEQHEQAVEERDEYEVARMESRGDQKTGSVDNPD